MINFFRPVSEYAKQKLEFTEPTSAPVIKERRTSRGEPPPVPSHGAQQTHKPCREPTWNIPGSNKMKQQTSVDEQGDR